MELPTATITRRENVAKDLFKIWLEPSVDIQFKPGQYYTIGKNSIERPYSVASAPGENELELFVEYIEPPEGQLTPLLEASKVGEILTLRPRPKGLFLFQPEYQNHVMVSTVTGVAPYVSVLRDMILRNSADLRDKNFFIFQGASYYDEFGYNAELQRYAEQYPNIKYIPTVSRPGESTNRAWSGHTGRVNTIVMNQVQNRFRIKPESTILYACGHPQMIADMRQQAGEHSLKFIEERFWKD